MSRYETQDAYPHANHGDPGWNPEPPTIEQVMSEFFECLPENIGIEDLEGDEAELGKKLASLWEIEKDAQGV